jgi:hypothetical protein
VARLTRTDDPAEPFDPRCKRFARTMKEYDDAITDGEEGVEVTPRDRIEYVQTEDETFNPRNGHFLCDRCYIEAGMPSTESGWRCP